MSSMKKIRQSNFELLRIISMFMIISFHYAVHSIDKLENNFNFGSNFVYTFFIGCGPLAVLIFIMITGYFMIKSDIKIKRLIELEIQVLFYSLLGLLVWVIFIKEPFTVSELIKSILPNLSNSYWFFTSYFAIYLFIPFINKFLLKLTEKEFKKLLLLGFIYLILIPTFFAEINKIHGGIYLEYYYTLGAYFRLYSKTTNNSIKYFIFFCLSYLTIIMICIGFKISFISNTEIIYYLSKRESILVFICAVSIFLFFKNININYNLIINKIASLTFGIYLCHENIFIKKILWNKIFVINSNSNLLVYISKCVSSFVIVFIVCSIIELLRQRLFKKVNLMLVKKTKL